MICLEFFDLEESHEDTLFLTNVLFRWLWRNAKNQEYTRGKMMYTQSQGYVVWPCHATLCRLQTVSNKQ